MTEQTATVTVYRTRSCPYCVAAEQLLRAKGVDFDEVYLDDHPDRGNVTAALLPGHYTVPLVVIDDAPIGGFNELRQLDESGALRSRLFAG